MKCIDAHLHIFERMTGYAFMGEFRPLGNGRVRWASGAEDLARVRVLKEQYGRTWPVQWLKERGLPDWAEAWEDVDRAMEADMILRKGDIHEEAV